MASNPAAPSFARYSSSSSAPATQPTHKSMLCRISAAISPRVTTSDTANRPPGFKTRNASRNTLSLSAERLITQFEMITSTELSGKGMCSISPRKNSTFSAPALRLFSFASASISSVMSRPYALPVGPTRLAESKTSIPPPDPRSSTTSPAFNFASAVGLPHPIEACSANSGTCSICRGSYKFEEIGSQEDSFPHAAPQHELPPAPARKAACPYFSRTISWMFASSILASPILPSKGYVPEKAPNHPQPQRPSSGRPGHATDKSQQCPAAAKPCSAYSTPNRETASAPEALPCSPCTAKKCFHVSPVPDFHSSICPNGGTASNSEFPTPLEYCRQRALEDVRITAVA